MRGERVTLLFTCLTSDLSPHLMGTHTQHTQHLHQSIDEDSVRRRFSVSWDAQLASSEGAPSTRPLTLKRTRSGCGAHRHTQTDGQYIYHFIYRSGNLPMQWPFDRLFVQAPMRHTLLTPSLRTTSPQFPLSHSSIFLALTLTRCRCHLSSLAHLFLAIYLIRCGLSKQPRAM